MQAVNNRTDRFPRANNQQLDGFAIALRVAVELEGEFKTDGFGGLGSGSKEGLSLHNFNVNH